VTAAVQKLSAAEAHRVICKLAAASPAVHALVLDAVKAEAAQSKGPGAKAGAPSGAPPAKGGGAAATPAAAGAGKDKAWGKLTANERTAAVTLGYSEASWENQDSPEASAMHWKKLNDKMRKACQVLGYTQEEWDADAPDEPEAKAAPAKAAPKENGAAPKPKAPTAAEVAAKEAKAKAAEAAEAAATAEAAAVAEAAEAAEAKAEGKVVDDDDGWATVTTKRKGAKGGGEKEEKPVRSSSGGGAPERKEEARPPRDARPDGPPRERKEFSKSSAPVPRALSSSAAAATSAANATGGPPATAAEIEAVLAAYDNGMVFGCKNDTYEENMQRNMFGLPRQHMAVVEKITERTVIFLLNYSSKVMHGIFILDGKKEEACGLNLVADAWIQNRNLLARANDNAPGSPFPAQVRVKSLRKCAPIKEPAWTHIPSVKHRKPGGPLHYELWLSKAQAHEIIKLFLTRG